MVYDTSTAKYATKFNGKNVKIRHVVVWKHHVNPSPKVKCIEKLSVINR